MRLQLAFPEAHFLSNDKYNQFFTMHGSTMMFLFAVPMMFEALSVYLVPLMVGTRNIAFPRLNAYSYYLYVFGGIMFYVAFLCNTGRGPRMVLLCAARRPGLRARQAAGFLGAADHVYRGLGAGRRGGNRRHRLSTARAGHVAEPHSHVRLGPGGRRPSW